MAIAKEEIFGPVFSILRATDFGEAMKMNNDLKARRPGRVQEIYVSTGERVEQGRALLLLTQD
jgi:acyl-CoA reductase-like NAD-dependent aldehyde dehydrogenase